MRDDEKRLWTNFRDGYVVERHDGEIVGIVFRKGKVWYSMVIGSQRPVQGTATRQEALDVLMEQDAAR